MTAASAAPGDHAATDRRARVGVAAALASRIFGRLVGVVLVVVLARSSDPTTVALYGFLLGTVTLMTSVTDLGVASLAGRDVAGGLATPGEALRRALGPQCVSGALAVAGTCAVAVIAGPEGVGLAVLVPSAVFVALNALLNLWGEVLRGAGRGVLEGLLQGGSAALLVVAGTLAVAAGAGVVELMWIVAAKELVALLVAVLCVPPDLRVHGGLRFAALLRRSLWLAAAGTALVVLWRQGTLLVSTTAPTRALADYVVATRFLDAAVTLAHTLGIGLFPALAVRAERSPADARRQVRRYAGLLSGVSVAGAALGVLLARPVTTGLFGDEWLSAVGAVRALAVAAPGIAVGYLLWFALLAEGEERWLCVAAACAALTGVTVTGLLLLVSPSAESAAWGTGAGVAVLVGLLLARLARPPQRARDLPRR